MSLHQFLHHLLAKTFVFKMFNTQSSLLSIWPFIIYQNKMHSCSTNRVAFPAILPPPHSHSISLAGWEHHHCGGAAAPGSHSQPITESLQPADYSVDSTASFNRHCRTTTQQDTGSRWAQGSVPYSPTFFCGEGGWL